LTRTVETSYFELSASISKTVEDSPSYYIIITNGKLHMRFRLAPKSMTLDDLKLL